MITLPDPCSIPIKSVHETGTRPGQRYRCALSRREAPLGPPLHAKGTPFFPVSPSIAATKTSGNTPISAPSL